MPNARKSAINCLIRVLEEGGYSNIAASSEIGEVGLSPQDKSLAYAIFYGVLERKITLDYYLRPLVKSKYEKLSPLVLNTLRAGAFQIIYLNKIPDSAAVNESVSIIKYSKERSAAGLINAVLRALIREYKPLPEALLHSENIEALSVKYSCRPEIISSLIKDYGFENTCGILEHSFSVPEISIRVNTLKTDRNTLKSALISRGISCREHEYLENALLLKSPGDIAALPEFAAGLFHVQGEASQICCGVLDPAPGDTVFDACAAPGGKTATMAQMMNNQGKIVARELHPHRGELINKTLARLGITAAKVEIGDSSIYDSNMEKYDKILCDVPCSGLGIMRKKPEIRYKFVTDLDILSEIQYRILCASVRYLKPEGFLVYSTCTLRRAENEDVISRFLTEHPEFETAGTNVTSPERGENTGGISGDRHIFTLMPHIQNTDGFFIAKLRRK